MEPFQVPKKGEAKQLASPFILIQIKMENLSTKIKGIIGTVASNVNDLNKDYAAEKITAVDKKDQIDTGLNIAQYRAVNAIKSTFNDILATLKTERLNSRDYERIKDLFNEQL